MSKMGTSFSKGRRISRVLALSLVFSLLLAMSGAMSASAWSLDDWNWPWGDNDNAKFAPQVADTTEQDAIYDCSVSDEVNFKASKIFWCDPNDDNAINKVKAFKITFRGKGTLKLNVDESYKEDSGWTDPQDDNTQVTIYYKSDKAISAANFNNLMNLLSVTFEPQKNEKYGSGTVTVVAYSDKGATDGSIIKTDDKSNYTCTLAFYDYAKGTLDTDAADMDYKAEYMTDFDQSYDDAMAEIAQDNDKKVLVTPENLAGGKTMLTMYLSDLGAAPDEGVSNNSGSQNKELARTASVGYQIKLKSETWNSTVAYNWIMDEDGENPKQYDLTTWDVNEPINIEVEGLDSGKDYTIRCIVATDKKYDKPRATSEVLFRYNTPNINSFNIGSTATVYKGGDSTMNISLLATFNDTNALNRTYTDNDGDEVDGYLGVDGTYHLGPALKAELYITTDKDFETVVIDGETIPTYDNSVWYKMPTTVQDADGDVMKGAGTMIKELYDAETGVTANTLQASWDGVSLPKTLYGITKQEAHKTVALDSTKMAFKLVVTDLYTGYATVAYSDVFTVDSTAPTDLQIWPKAEDEDTSEGTPARETLDPSVGKTVGGLDATVSIRIGDAKDENGSGIKEYDYSIYYLTTQNADKLSFANTAAVLEALRNAAEGVDGSYTVTDGTKTASVEYTDWSAAEDAYYLDGENKVYVENTTEVQLSKDGYYRIDAKAIDDAGYSSAVESAYFRVDRSQPATPQVRLMKKNSDGTFSPYDGRTYTTSDVWLFAYSKPQTGKQLAEFEYTTDGANWISMTASSSVSKLIASNIDDESTFSTIYPYAVGQYVTTEAFKYQVGYNVSATESDYTSFMVRVTDKYGNKSDLSESVIMRTVVDAPKANSVLVHQDIEAALAVGNTTIETSTLIKEIKNATAKKINLAFYGVNSAEYNAIANHDCTWSDSACTGACNATNCPYNSETVEYFTPEMVSVQGVSADPTDQSDFDWKRYDHSYYSSVDGHQIATVAYTNASHLATNLQPDTGYDYFTYNNTKYYTASQDRVVYIAQNTVDNVTNGLPNDLPNDQIPGTAGTNKSYLLCRYIGQDTSSTFGAMSWQGGISGSYQDRYTSAGKWTGIIWRRIYHMLDFSQAKSDGSVDLGVKGDLSTIVAINGYAAGSFKDWMMVYNNQPTRKEINFTINDANVNTHSADFWGFLFNCTIRPAVNKQSTFESDETDWRLSGYMFMIGLDTGTYDAKNLTQMKWWIIKIDNVNMEQFSDGCLVKGGNPSNLGTGWNMSRDNSGEGNQGYPYDNFDDVPLGLISDPPYTHPTKVTPQKRENLFKFPDGGELLTVAYSEPDYAADNTPKVRNFKLITEGNYTTLYVYNSNTTELTTEQLEAKWAEYNGSQTIMTGNAIAGEGYTAVRWKKSWLDHSMYDDENIPDEKKNNSTTVYTPRPTVDGVRMGTYWARVDGIHTDTNCYGFGPIVGARGSKHAEPGCFADSRIVYTNVSLKMDVARSLTEVVNEPQWGGSSSKFIINISDDSIEDFADPVLSSQVQWRLFKDNAKFIGWGGYDNEVATLNFLKRVEGKGTFISTVKNVQYDENTNLPKREKRGTDGKVIGDYVTRVEQIDSLAEYMTREYYSALGYMIDDDKALEEANVKTEVQNKVASTTKDNEGNVISGKGATYTLDEIKNINFSVTPSKYATSTANRDFPQGRWYIVHDTQGFEKTTSDGGAIAKNYSDALDLNITEPGRYTVYFAPDSEKVDTDTLNPDDTTCVFDFIVNTPPVAQFSGYIENGTTVHITDESYDPDNGKSASEGDTASYVNGVAVSGVDKSKTEWHIMILGSEINDATEIKEVTTVYDSGWKLTSQFIGGKIDGNSLSNLTSGKRTKLNEGEVLTVYQRVTDYNARRVLSNVSTASTDSTNYTYVQQKGTTSNVLQQNLTGEAVTITNAPMSSFNVSTVNVYNTADDDYTVDVTRSSTQTQGKAFKVSWALDYDGQYYELARDTLTDNYYLCSASFYAAEAARKEAAGDSYVKPVLEAAGLAALNSAYGVYDPVATRMANGTSPYAVLVYKSGNPNESNSGSHATDYTASGVWTISKGAIDKLKSGVFSDSSKVVLQMTETCEGFTQSQVSKPDFNANTATKTKITGYSARAIYYKRDTKAPSLQTVTIKFTGNVESDKYEASNYLDVSNNDRFIEITVGGSVDKEGKLKGYKYYFYSMDSNGNENTSGQYYSYNPSTQKLTPVNSKAAALCNLNANGGTIKIGRNTMINDPTSSLNVAIYAYDNQTNAGTLSGGNETACTRVQEIKLSVSKPMPTEINVSNALSQTVTKVGNSNGYINMNDSADQQSPAYPCYSNTVATVEFTPKQAKYKSVNGQLVEADETSSSLSYFQDIYKAADLTGVAKIVYQVYYKPNTDTSSWWTEADFNKAGMSYDAHFAGEVEISNTQTLTFSTDGVYMLTARVKNGSGTLSEPRTVNFIVDTTAPTAPTVKLTNVVTNKLYTPGTWAKQVKAAISGSDDTNYATSYYEISVDGGKTWSKTYNGKELGKIRGSTECLFEDDGERNVMIRATDPAGNSSTAMMVSDSTSNFDTPTYNKQTYAINIRVDGTAPDTPGPTLTATSEETKIMDRYIICVDVIDPTSEEGESGQGAVYFIQDGKLNQKDNQVTVKTGEGVTFEIVPADGCKVGKVTYVAVDESGKEKSGQTDESKNVTDQLKYDDQSGGYLFEVENVKSDWKLNVTFIKDSDMDSEAEVAYLNMADYAFATRAAIATLSDDEGGSETPPNEAAGNPNDGEDEDSTPGAGDTETPDDNDGDSGEPTEISVTAEAYGSGGSAEMAQETVTANTSAVLKVSTWDHYRVQKIELTADGEETTELDVNSYREGSDGWKYIYDVPVGEKNLSITVYFEEIPYRVITVKSSDCGVAELLGSGVESLGDSTYNADIGAEVTINTIADTGYAVTKLIIGADEYTENIPNSFTVPDYTETSDPGFEIYVEFDVSPLKAFRTFEVSVVPDEDGNVHGTISPTGEVKIPASGSRTFIVKPDDRYYIADISVTTESMGETNTEHPEPKALDGSNGGYYFTVTQPSSNGTITVEFAERSYKITTEVVEGKGDIGVAMDDPNAIFSWSSVPEGSKLKITPRASSDYVLRELVIIHNDNQYFKGAATSVTIDYLEGDLIVRAYFDERKLSKIETTHKITAVANNVSDKNDALHETEAYCFKISDGINESVPSTWSTKNDIEFTGILVKGATEEIPLKPNARYAVSVMTQDKVGNKSEWMTSYVYTQANMPGLTGVETIDDGDPVYKTVSLSIDENENPSGTEYQVYYSLSASMEPMMIANLDEEKGVDGWATLKNGRFEVTKLDPGNRYYFKVVARNSDRHNSSVSEDTINTMLSPAAPKSNTLYFDDQDSPGGPVTLYWDSVKGDVTAVQIYLDGRPLALIDDMTQTQYKDESNIMANAVDRYSYAYVNSSGAGSSCEAVSMEYRDAVMETENKDKQEKMDSLKRQIMTYGNYDGVFSDTITYPAFPTQIKSSSSNIRASITAGEATGQIVVKMNDTTTSNIARYQNYKLTLKAYRRLVNGLGEDILDDEGNPTYSEYNSDGSLITISDWDIGKKYTNTDGTQKANESQIRKESGESGSWVVWTGLSPAYEYKVFVEEISSSGPASENNYLAGQQYGVEAQLGKKYVVNKEGYYFTYTKDNTEPKLTVKSGKWSDAEGENADSDLTTLDEYTYGQGWDVSINEGYIKFNKSPNVDLANEDDIYYGNDPEKIKTDSEGQQYILIDNSMSDMTFNINVAVWDDEIRENSLPYVKGSISGTSGVSNPAMTETSTFPAGEDIAKQRENLYRVTFDASGMSTGVYDTMTIRAYDGDTETNKDVKIKLVVNNHTPLSEVTNGTRQLVQKDKLYDADKLLAVETRVAADYMASKQLSEVALTIMSLECTNALGYSDYDTLYNKLCVAGSVDSDTLAKAQALLDKDADTYITDGVLSERGLNVAITRIATPVTYYTNISAGDYSDLYQNAENRQYLREEPGRDGSTYWAELYFAIDKGKCSWMALENGQLKPIAEVTGESSKDTYTLRMVANFGGNTSAQSVDYIVKREPSATIQSEKKMGWVKTSNNAEINAFGTLTVQQVIDRYTAAYGMVTPDLGDYVTTDLAAQVFADGNTYVFKPSDSKATLGVNYINGHVEIDLGVYDSFDSAGVVVAKMTPDQFNPNNDEIDPNNTFTVVVNNQNPIISSGVYKFYSSNLAVDTTYYFWSYYVIDGKAVYSMTYQAMTTMQDFKTASFGFKNITAAYEEEKAENADIPVSIDISKLGEKTASGNFEIIAKYYEADQYGNFVLDETTGEKKLLTGDRLKWARETLNFKDETVREGNDSLVVEKSLTEETTLMMALKYNEYEEGHMILRLELKLINSTNEYCEVREEDRFMDIHVLDNNSYIISYKIGVKNDDGELTEIADSTKNTYYTYEYAGLPVDYTQTIPLQLKYVNDGDGDLENISIAVYKEKVSRADELELSDEFVAGQLSDKNLKKALNSYGTVEIRPRTKDSSGQDAKLTDGVYEAWIAMTADNIKDPDEWLWVRVRLVVGQSTLTGRVYITSKEAGDNDYTGQAKVMLYRSNDVQTYTDPATGDKVTQIKSGSKPAYETMTEKYGGKFTIPYILNQGSFGSTGRYYIVIERDGFVTYDNVSYNKGTATSESAPMLVLGSTSNTYTLEIQLKGGDVDQDQDIDKDDLQLLASYYNRYVDEAGVSEEENAIIKRCDFNQDGVVNALDRAYLYGNQGFDGTKYSYGLLFPDE